MTAPRYCQCGRKILVTFHPTRNPKSAKGVRTSPDHDLCRECWRRLMTKAGR